MAGNLQAAQLEMAKRELAKRQGSAQTATPPTNSMSGLGITGFGAEASQGFLADVAHSAAGVASAGGWIQNQFARLPGMGWLKTNIAQNPIQQGLLSTQAPNTIAGVVGQGTGELAQLMGPTKAISVVQEGLEGVTEGSKLIGALPKIGQYAAQTAAHVIPEAGFGAAYGATRPGATPQSIAENAIGFGIASGIFKGFGDAYQALRGDLGTNVLKAIGMTGRMSPQDVIGRTAEATNGLKVIADNAAGTVVKDINGVEHEFNPLKATYFDTLQALKIAKDKVYGAYDALATKAGDQGVNFGQKEFGQVITDLQGMAQDATGAFKSKVGSLIKDIQDNFGKVNPVDGSVYFKNTPLKRVQTFLEKLNTDVNPLSDKAAAEVSGKASQSIREILDSKITSATGQGYQDLRNQYAALKSIENNLVNQAKKALGARGGTFGDFLEQYGSLDVLVSGIRGDIPGMVKGAGLSTIGAIRNYLRDPEAALQRSFQMITGADKASSAAGRVFGLPTQ